MYLLSVKGKENEGVYALVDDLGEKALCIFVDKDDAERYTGLLYAEDYPEMTVIEVEDDIAIKTCELYDCKYVIITPDDFVIPPRNNDYFQKNKMA